MVDVPDTPAPEPSEVLRLAATGMDIDAIARRLGVTRHEASQALARESAEVREALPDQEGDRLIERTHLDILRRTLLPAALAGDIGAARLLVRIHSARALLLGLLDELPADDQELEEVNELDRIRARRTARRQASS